MKRVLLACVFARAAHAFALHGASAPSARGSVASHRASAPSVVRMAVDTTPSRVELTQNYRDAEDRSARFAALKSAPSKRVVVVGGGLSGLACAKYLVDAGHRPVVLEARDVLGGKVSAWQDEDGDWIETGLHIFFGAYPNMLNLFAELGIRDRLQWKQHRMVFARPDAPGETTAFEFPDGVPAPFNMALAILANPTMLTWDEKLRMVPALLPMLLFGQDFIDAQDELSVSEYMDRWGMPRRVNDEIFIAMAKALDFIDPDRLSMTVILTAMNRFINEADGSQTAFLDGNQPERLCRPIQEYVEARGGEVRTNAPVAAIEVDDGTGRVTGLRMRDGALVDGFDEYVSAMPVDVFKKLVPSKWSTMPFFAQLDELEGIPVMNVQLWFDRKLRGAVDGLAFSRSPLLSVYADMAASCREYADPQDRSCLSLVFAPCSPRTGADVNWIAKPDDEVVAAAIGELERLFPDEVAADGSKAKLRKSSVVRVPRSVYSAVPGRNKFRPSQVTPIDNFVLAGDFTSQKFLGSMEGAVLAGKLAAEIVARRAAGAPATELKEVEPGVVDAAAGRAAREPTGVRGDSAIAYGGGALRSRADAEAALAPATAEPPLIAA